jgi:hypothetical protein
MSQQHRFYAFCRIVLDSKSDHVYLGSEASVPNVLGGTIVVIKNGVRASFSNALLMTVGALQGSHSI